MKDLYKTFVVDITENQRWALDPYIKSIKPGEGLIAQVYGDGMRVKKLTVEQSLGVMTALMGAAIVLPMSNSAHEAHKIRLGCEHQSVPQPQPTKRNLLDISKRLQARGFFSASTCADAATNADMKAMRDAIESTEVEHPDMAALNAELIDYRAQIAGLLARISELDEPRSSDGVLVRPDNVHNAAQRLIQFAKRADVVITIERRPLRPPAMGHAEYVIETRPVRGAA